MIHTKDKIFYSKTFSKMINPFDNKSYYIAVQNLAAQ